MEICNKCGLPKDLCICEDLSKETQKIRVYTNTRRFKKLTTVIDGIDPKNVNIKELSQKLKTKFACGGTIKDGRIELQGDHREEVKKLLVSYGFSKDLIELKS
ncbi:stress response translation initiation inhibitor YciH [Methanocella sp. CWC-04]|uniref:Protein translation factor SUI1 homolog n=1 Tax=Methanooceanicella nereidis TaxID=2052831 RepID=A0AAP2RCU5_9EURY|nr:stress response translation initiation inhibitor YciH [Methanocella sp. CWC-04]MCD1294968.1 stress response translation initiation inhibitor YciH [Methanocella sp. CWC-04]